MPSYAIAVNPNDPQQFIRIEQPKLIPGDNDLLVSVKASAMNPVDTKVHASLIDSGLQQPRVLGWDASAIVLATGKNVRHFLPDDEVWYAGDITRAGSNATEQLVDSRLVAHKPKTLSWAEAAAMPLTSLTAWEGLFERLKIQQADKNKTLLIIGGAGGVGSLAISLAALRSQVRIIATASNKNSAQWCLDRGAHLTIDYHQLQQQLSDNGINEVDYVFCLNNTDQHWPAITNIIAPFGHICSIVESKKPLEQQLIRAKSVALHWELMFTRSHYQTADMAEQGHILSRMTVLIDNGKLAGTLRETLNGLTVENIELAHKQQLTGHMKGKLVIIHSDLDIHG